MRAPSARELVAEKSDIRPLGPPSPKPFATGRSAFYRRSPQPLRFAVLSALVTAECFALLPADAASRTSMVEGGL